MSTNTATPSVTLKTTAVNAPGSAEPRELLQPKFFPGQLLTSDDLSALETWVKQRLALQHQNSGWGVVCGLEVTGDSQSPTRIHIAPGYAVDAAGQAIFVGQEYTACLGQFCGAMGCNDPSGSDCADDASDESLFQIGGYGVPRKYVRRIDLSLHYQTKDQDLRPVLPGPGKPPVCKPARMAETFEVHATPQPLPDAPPISGGQTPAAISPAVDPCLQRLGDFGKSFPDLWKWTPAMPLPAQVKGADVAAWFKNQMGSMPAGGFLFLASLIADIQGPADGPAPNVLPWQAAEALFWLTQSCRQQGGPCVHCPDASAGVPLAHIWLYTSGADCRILFIDGGQVYRRGLAPPFITAKGDVDLSDFYGKEWSSVQVGLSGYGLNAVPEVARIPASPQGVQTLLRYQDASYPPLSSAHPQQPVVALVSRVAHWEGRAVGYYGAPTLAQAIPRPAVEARILDIVAVKPSKPADDPPGLTSSAGQFPPPNSFKDGPVPNDGYLQFAMKVGGFDAWPLTLCLYDDLRRTLSSIDLSTSQKSDELCLLTNIFKVPAGIGQMNAVPVQFTLLAQSKDGRNCWSVSKLAVQIGPQAFYAQLQAPEIQIADTVGYSVTAKNPGLYAVTLNFTVDGVAKVQMLTPNNQDIQQIFAENGLSGAAATMRTIVFTAAQDEFMRTVPGFSTIKFSLSPNIVFSIAEKNATQADKIYTLTTTNKETGLTLTSVTAAPLDGADHTPIPIGNLPGTPLLATPQTFDFPGPAAALKKWQIVAKFTLSSSNYTMTTMSPPNAG